MILPRHAYNPSLLRFQGRLLLSYRIHDRGDWRTSLAIAELDADFKPISSKPFIPPAELKDNSHEDARAFIHQGAIWLSWTVSQYPATEFRSIVCYGQLLESPEAWRIGQFFVPAFGQNDFTGIEKNWVFWPHGEKLWCLYMTHANEQIWLQLEGARVEELHKSKALPCPWGTAIHGGAICPGENGNLLHFWNSHTAHRDRSLDRYLVGCAELSGHPPFDVLRISKRPILVGEEGACLDKNPHYKSSVAFCCGAMKTTNDSWLLSWGWNDCQCRISKLFYNDLHL